MVSSASKSPRLSLFFLFCDEVPPSKMSMVLALLSRALAVYKHSCRVKGQNKSHKIEGLSGIIIICILLIHHLRNIMQKTAKISFH